MAEIELVVKLPESIWVAIQNRDRHYCKHFINRKSKIERVKKNDKRRNNAVEYGLS